MSNQLFNVIEASNISKEFRDGKRIIKVLDGVDFSVQKGEMVSIVGSSGSGKSTLLHILGALDSPTQGTVLINSQPIHQYNEKMQAKIRNKNLGFVYQFHHLLAEFSALENVALPCLLAGYSIKNAQLRATKLIEAVGLSDRSTHKPGELSGGEKQRIAFARALATQPGCVLADEPTGNLDQETAKDVFKWMCSLNERFETSFVMVTHDQQLAAKTDRVLTLTKGVLS
ncbi:MAG: lipoprotein-releasing system ATP-binding protein LolD [Gammaproteobacteria bacterium CG22_combo_CG10-13_8_21_14_all_40_8]|nr:MAG: lipoprotein-releasing system ATP-binding protein LolD [Gammaproteobacteria bacterium CG22_combo_CG10-13_8_21_14_all_40_8]